MIQVLPAASRYSLDTSSLITAWARHYPKDLFGPVWEHLDKLIGSQIVIASSEVLVEIERQDDELHEWCRQREHAFIDLIEPIQANVTKLMTSYAKMVLTGRNRADPFVVATAQLDPERIAVVTEENPSNVSANRPNIPYVCQQEKIRRIQFVTMLRETGFGL